MEHIENISRGEYPIPISSPWDGRFFSVSMIFIEFAVDTIRSSVFPLFYYDNPLTPMFSHDIPY
jgi:hypothetical protein